MRNPLWHFQPYGCKDVVGQRRSLKRVPLHSAETFTAALPECRFLCLPLVSGVASLILSQGRIPFGRSFSCKSAKQKSRYTETPKQQKSCSCYRFDETMYRLWNSNPCCLLFNQPRKQTMRRRLVRQCSACRQFFLKMFHLYLVVVPRLREVILYITEWLFVKILKVYF